MSSMTKRGKDSYRLIVELGYDAKGNRIRHTKTIKAKNKTEAQKELVRFEAEIMAGEYVAPQKMTLREFVKNQWLPHYAIDEEDGLSPSTRKNYLDHLERRVLPVFGEESLSDIKTPRLVKFFADLKVDGSRQDGKKLSQNTVLYIYKIMWNVFSRAVKWKFIKVNPMEGVDRPSAVKVQREFYGEQEANAVIKALFNLPTNWRIFFLGSMMGGFRRGELTALQWSDVDFDYGGINVNRSISLTEGGKAVVGKPKTDASVDFVDMPLWYMEELQAFKEEWDEQRDNVADRWEGGNDQYLFHAGFGKPYFYNTPSLTWRRFLKKYEFRPVRLHDLRHSAASLLLEEDVPLKVIQERLRHSRFEVTADIYAHVTKTAKKKTASKLEKFDPRKIGHQSVTNDQKSGKLSSP